MSGCINTSRHRSSKFRFKEKFRSPPRLEGHVEAARLLLEAKADQNAMTTFMRQTALQCVARFGETEVVRLLLEVGAQAIPQKNLDGAIYGASVNGHMGTVKELLESKASVNSKNSMGSPTLKCALREGHAGLVGLLLAAQACTGMKNGWGYTSLRFLDATGGKDGSSWQDWMVLHYASHRGHADTVCRLLRGRADAFVTDDFGYTALERASERGHSKVAGLLLSADWAGNNKYLQGSTGWRALHSAARKDMPSLHLYCISTQHDFQFSKV